MYFADDQEVHPIRSTLLQQKNPRSTELEPQWKYIPTFVKLPIRDANGRSMDWLASPMITERKQGREENKPPTETLERAARHRSSHKFQFRSSHYAEHRASTGYFTVGCGCQRDPIVEFAPANDRICRQQRVSIQHHPTYSIEIRRRLCGPRRS